MTFVLVVTVTFPCGTGGFSSGSSAFCSCWEGLRGEGLRAGEADFLRDGDLDRERRRRPEANFRLGEAERLRLRNRAGFYKRKRQTNTRIMSSCGHIRLPEARRKTLRNAGGIVWRKYTLCGAGTGVCKPQRLLNPSKHTHTREFSSYIIVTTIHFINGFKKLSILTAI